MKVSLEILETQHNPNYTPEFPTQEKTAIHSGRLGDVIYSLPTIRMLGVNHIYLNVFHPHFDDRRIFTLKAIKQLRPLLLAQPYIKTVSITSLDLPLETLAHPISGVDYNLDRYRNLARHKIPDENWPVDEQVRLFSKENVPVHLTQCFAISQGLRCYPRDPWIFAPKDDTLKETVLVSLTHRWRSFPEIYWKYLLSGLRNIEFVGMPSEGMKDIPVHTAKDHLELASKIAGCRLFLGTVSFPYAIAEGLKVNRAMEVCHFNLNAFPIGEPDRVLNLDVLKAREQVADFLALHPSDPYREQTRFLMRRPNLQLFRLKQWAYLKRAKFRVRTEKAKFNARARLAA